MYWGRKDVKRDTTAKVHTRRLWRRLHAEMLAQIYGWFSEGFDTADLKEARALLETLS